MSSRDERVEKAMAELKRVDDARLAALVDGRAANAMFEEVVGMTEPTSERREPAGRGAGTRADRPRRPRRLWRVGIAVAVVAVVAGVLAVVNPFGSNGLTVVQRAAAALAPANGQILHIKMLGEQNNGDGTVVKWSDESWQATTSPYDRRQIEVSPEGTTVDSATIGDATQLYDPVTDTIYAPPAVATDASAPPAPKVAGVPSLDKIRKVSFEVGPDSKTITVKMVVAGDDGATTTVKRVLDNQKAKALVVAWQASRDAEASASPAPATTPTQSPDVQADPFRAEILAMLKSGQVREDGHLTVDGREAIKLVGTEEGGRQELLVDAATYDPIEWRTAGDGGGTVLRFVVYETLPDSSAARALLDLKAQHPGARVDTDPADYQKASARLFPNG